MKKRIFSILLAVAMLLLCVPMGAIPTVMAETEYTEGYYTYTVFDGKATITAVDTAISGAVTIPSTLGGYPVTGLGYQAFYRCTSLTSVTIPEGVIDVGLETFRGCKALTAVSLPNSLSYISSQMFSGCSSLVKVVIPDGVTSISSYAFSSCSNLLSITIPNSVTDILPHAFSYCSN